MGELTSTIVICTRNRPESLRRCLEALRRIDRENVLVVDNASETTETREVAAALGVRYILEPVVGVNRARNTGARHCTTDLVIYTDDDTIPTAAWLPNLRREFSDERVMAVGGRIVPGDGQRVDDSFAALISGYDCGTERQVVDRNTHDWFERTNFGGLGNGANMAFRRSGFNRWQGFDERIGYGSPMRGYGDHNAFFRVVQSGFRAVYAPEAIVFHPIDESTDDIISKRLRAVRAWAAYVILLAVEHPEHRRGLVRYLSGALRGVPRHWRPANRPRIPEIARWRTIAAALPGPLLYLRVRMKGSRPRSHV